MEDVLLVLGYSTDMTDPIFRSRMDRAIALFEAGTAQQLLVSGCCSMKLDRRPEFTEAEAMRDYAMDRGVPMASILLEEESVDTLGNFYFSKVRFLEPLSWYHVGIVTTPWHAWRSEWLASQILGEDYSVTMYPSEHPDGWDEAAIRKSELTNRTLLTETQDQLQGVSLGDHEAITPFLGKMPPR